MKKLFQKWIFAVVALAFLLTFAISFGVNTRHARLGSLALIRLKLSDASAQLSNAVHNVDRVTELSDEAVLLKSKLFAEAVKSNPDILSDKAALARFCKEMDVDELYALDPEWNILMAYPEATARRSYKDLELPDKLPASGPVTNASGHEIQYAAVKRLDADGILVIGDKPEHLLAAKAIADIRNFSEGFRIGLKGGVLIAKDNKLICDGMLELPEKNLPKLGFPLPLPKDEPFTVAVEDVEYLASAIQYGEYTIIGLLPYDEVYYRRNLAQSVLVIVYLVLFGLIFALIAILLNKIVLSGIDKVCASLQRITDGDLSEIVDVHNCKEFDLLSGGINATVTALKTAIAEAARRLDNELALAEAIQCSALPRSFPAFPERKDFDIYATMSPAREVGGDFYDFFMIDDNHLAFLVADVSEKGIPAALFMMTGKTWLKGLALAGIPPKKVFEEANRMLSRDNATGMFITVFYGVLELSSGELTCINAGHNPPLLRRGGGKYEYLKLEPDFLLGTLPNVQYTAHRMRLAPGERLFLYTDGVTEAQTSNEEQFGTERLQAVLNRAEVAPRQTVELVISELKIFTGEAPQYDDITMLALEYRGCVLKLDAVTGNLPQVQQFLEQCCTQYGLPENTHLLIAAEEIFLNIANYAYAPGTGTAEISFDYLPAEQRIRLTFTDSGKPYDPLTAPEPQFEELQIGGMGIHITRTLAATLEYSYRDGQNILTVGINAAKGTENE